MKKKTRPGWPSCALAERRAVRPDGARIENAEGLVSESRGRLAEAEAALQRDVELETRLPGQIQELAEPAAAGEHRDRDRLRPRGPGGVGAAQGRVVEGESDVRRVLRAG